MQRFDKAALMVLLLATAGLDCLARPPRNCNPVASGGRRCTLVRLARWAGDRTLAEPLVAVLHLGYALPSAGGRGDCSRNPDARASWDGSRTASVDGRGGGSDDAGGDDAGHAGPYRAGVDRRAGDGGHLCRSCRGSAGQAGGGHLAGSGASAAHGCRVRRGSSPSAALPCSMARCCCACLQPSGYEGSWAGWNLPRPMRRSS